MIYSGTYTVIKADVPEFFMRKLIKLEKISTDCKRIQKKWLTRGIFTCVVAIALIGSCRQRDSHWLPLSFRQTYAGAGAERGRRWCPYLGLHP